MVLIDQIIPRVKEIWNMFWGSVKETKETDPKFEIRDAENSMVISWLLNSMKPKIGRPFLYFLTAKKV